MTAILGYSFIFCARILDVSMGTIRVLLLMRGQKFYAAAIGFFEVIIFIVVLGMVVNELDNPLNLVMYGAGFATGNIVGSWLEEKLAVGLLTVQIISKQHSKVLVETLRDNGYGVTVIDSCGRDGKFDMLNMQIKRKDMAEVQKTISLTDASAYVTIYDTRKALGGYFKQAKKK